MDLVVEGIGKRYGSQWALRELAFTAGPGLIGLVGPNGAGKTTFMRILATLLRPDAGRVTWDGMDIQRSGELFRRRLGYLPQQFGLYPMLTARQCLHYLAAMKGLGSALVRERTEQALADVHLSEAGDRRLGEFSLGMKKRVGIAQALLNDPDLMVVDEPTTGLDPAERVRLRGLLAELAENRLVILSTHIIADVEAVAPRLILLRTGRLLADTTPEALVSAAEGAVWSVTVDSRAAADLRRRSLCSQMLLQPGGCALRLVARDRPHPAAIPVTPTLEEAYLLRSQYSVPGE